LRAPEASVDRAGGAAPVATPHSSQNFAVGRSSEPQLAQRRGSGAAHSSQNFAAGRLGCAQLGQSTKPRFYASQ
jgi:hypothetical protein